MANRLFDLPETKGIFQLRGIINGVENERFYTHMKTKTGKDFRAVNFGCEYNDKQTVYMNLTGMPQQNVYFSKRDKSSGKTETQAVAWAYRNKFNEDGYRMIGVNLGLTKVDSGKGYLVNDKKTMHQFDACDYISEHMQDGMSVFMRGNLDFSSYMDSNGDIHRRVKYIPSQISLCKEIDFDEYNEKKQPEHDFTQTIVFMGVEEELNDGEVTGRYVVSAKIVTYSDIVDTQFIITDKSVARTFKRYLKPYDSVEVNGRIEASHSVVESVNTNGWGRKSMNGVAAPSRIELIIDGGDPDSIDHDRYNEANVAEAIRKIRAAQTAEQNFSGKSTVSVNADNWGKGFNESSDDDDEDWG